MNAVYEVASQLYVNPLFSMPSINLAAHWLLMRLFLDLLDSVCLLELDMDVTGTRGCGLLSWEPADTDGWLRRPLVSSIRTTHSSRKVKGRASKKKYSLLV